MTFGGNTTPRRRVRGKRTSWKCVCVIAGRRKENPAYLTRCSTCGMGRR